jgi:hypothetical protein
MAPRLEPGSDASKEAVRKRRNDASTRPAGKRVKVSGRKAIASKASAAPRGTGAASSKAAPGAPKSTRATSSKAAPSKVAPSKGALMKAGAALKASASQKAGAPVKATVQKSTAIPSVTKAGVLKIGTGLERPRAEPAQAPKRKQARVNVASSSAFALIHRTIVRSQSPTESDDGRVVTCAMLGASSMVLCSALSSSDSSGLESIMASPPPVPDIVISVVL